MRKTHFVMCMLFGMFLHAQDSLLKTRIRLFDANLFLGFTISSPPEKTLPYLASTTQHKEYTSGDFVKGFGDTLRGLYRHHGFGPLFSGQAGISGSFQFANARSAFFKRLKPRFGIYHSAQIMYECGLRYENRTSIDTAHFVNPAFAPVAIDSVASGHIDYIYYRKSVYFELGLNFDILVKRRFIVYAGLVYGLGIAYNNRFSVEKYEQYYIDKKDNAASNSITTAEFKQTYKEPVNYATRITIPIGIQHRFALKHQFSVSMFGEMRTGFDMDKIKYGNISPGVIFMFTGGLRFSFRYHK